MKELALEIWSGFRAFPLWVQIWVGLILVPVNLAAIFFVNEPRGWLIAILAIGGMFPNLIILLTLRSWPKTMALPHVFIWTPLMFILWPYVGMHGFMTLLFAVNAVSLAFDFKDSWDWWRARS